MLHRDGHRCRVVENGSRCDHADPTGRTLHAHHLEAIADGGDPFDIDRIVTVCDQHHPRVEQERRARARRELERSRTE